MGKKSEEKDLSKELSDVLSDFDKIEAEKDKSNEVAVGKKHTKEELRKYGNWIVLLLLLIIVGWLFVVIYQEKKNVDVQKKPLWVIGTKKAVNEKTQGCIANLWKMRQVIDNFYARNRIFPASLEEIYKGGYLTERLLCPESGKAYIFAVIDGKTKVACPDPKAHGVGKIFVDVKVGPPVVVE